jgi:hypothetical protein
MSNFSLTTRAIFNAYHKEVRPEPYHQCEAIAAILLTVVDKLTYCDDYGAEHISPEDVLDIAKELKDWDYKAK